MNLNDISLEISYSSDSVGLVKNFYIPCLKRSSEYFRAVGYFTSSGLSVAAQGVSHLLNNGGRIKLVASPCLSEQDIEAIERGYSDRDNGIIDIVSKSFDEVKSELVKDRLNALAWLIASKGLDIKLALRVDSGGKLKRGIYHEKMGIFKDSNNNQVAFSGSPNETEGGLIENYEAIDVFCSWDDPHGRVQDKLSKFNRLWNNEADGLEVIDFTDATEQLLASFKRSTPPAVDPIERIGDSDWIKKKIRRNAPSLPEHITLRGYQEEAVNNWFDNKGRGTFKLATGTGKTITALGVASELSSRIELEALIVVCPYRHLVTQWADECERFNMKPIKAFESYRNWGNQLTNALVGSKTDQSEFICVITTNDTFSGENFQNKISFFPKKTLLIADEAHNLGAQNIRTQLPSSIGLRLALSATPERWYDEEGTQQIFNYFGSVLEPQLTIKDAITRKALVPYRYYPILIELTDDEREEYIELSAKIAQASHSSQNKDGDNVALTALLTRRSRLIASAKNKMSALEELIKGKANESHMLFYCGDGTVEDPVSEDEARHVDAVCKLLGSQIGIKVTTYTAETSLAERNTLQQQLDQGSLQGLVAIRCLDEGVDIPSVKTAYILASSQNPRQFIQRRGRVLRKYPGKDYAEIFDMIVVPPKDIISYDVERNLLKKELIRFAEFADIAINAGSARIEIHELQKRFDLFDI